MKDFIPEEKMSKKAKRALHQARRRDWGSVNPVTRKPANPKAYDRKKARRGDFPDAELFYAITNYPTSEEPVCRLGIMPS